MKKQIIGLGGCEHPALSLYILAQTNKKNPKVCFLPTASCDSSYAIKDFYESFDEYYCTTSHLSLFNLNVDNIKNFILEKDVIYVGGGHSKNMMAIWRGWGLDQILKEAYNKGIVLAGTSAGSVCWFEKCITDSYGKELRPMSCLNFIEGSNCPHYNNENRRPAFHDSIKNKSIPTGYSADNEAGLHFIDGKLLRAISFDQEAFGYKVENINNESVEIGRAHV
jgi:dipeptidase E